MSTPANPPKPVVNITHKIPGQPPRKFARIIFPDRFTPAEVQDTLSRFPESQGFRCDLRQVGPQGFSLPLNLCEVAS
jgi:hypothetical protein